jgi:hypothetical protein
MGATGKLGGPGGHLSTAFIKTRQSAKSAAMELGAADGVVDHGRSVAEQLAMLSQQFDNLETNFAKRIEGVEEELAEAKAMAAAAKAQVAVLQAALAAQSEVCAALSAEVKALRNSGLRVAPAEPSRAGAPGARAVAVSAAPASTPVPASSTTKVLVASSCLEVISKEDALAHAVQAVCLVGAFRSDCIRSAQLVAGGKDLLLQGQSARPSYAAAVHGASSPGPARPGASEPVVGQPKGPFMVEVVLANSQAASMVLRDAYKLAGVAGMERTFVRRALTTQQLRLKRRLAAAHAGTLQAARTGADTRVRYRDDLYPYIQRRGADGFWRTEQVFRDLPEASAPSDSGNGVDAASSKGAP